MTRPRRILRLLLLVLAPFWPASAWSQSCSFGVSAMNFGNIYTLSGAQSDTTATLSVSCTGIANTSVLICPNLNQGSGGATASARQMLSGTNILNYQLFQDAARSVVWGSSSWPYPARAPAFGLTLNSSGTGSGTTPIYGRAFAGQSTVPPGSYLSQFTGSHVEFRYRLNDGLGCNIGLGTISRPSFNVTATIPANCLVATQNVDFGNRGVLTANVDATGTVSVTCTPGTAYTVGLSNGQTGTSPTARRMTLGAQAVIYGLYRDIARSQPWGNTTGTNTVAGTGAGTAQNLTVYGRVAPQSTPTPGTYTDTVIVTVTY